MLRFAILIIVLCSLASADNWISQMKKSVRIKMRDAGQGLCDIANPCVNGFCEDNGTAIECFCDYPYSGEFCDQICPFEQCWEDYWTEMEEYWQGGDDGDYGEDNGSCEEHPMRRMTKSPGHLKRALAMRKRSSALAKKSMDRTYEEHCRDGIQDLLECFDGVMVDQSYCDSCDNGTTMWIAGILKDRSSMADQYCADSQTCMQKETANCIDYVDRMFHVHYGMNETERAKIDPAAFADHLVRVETCLTKIINEELSLVGCVHNSWAKDEMLLFLVEVIRAESDGCNMTKVGEDCGWENVEDLDVICPMTLEERSTLLDGVFECGRTEMAKTGARCVPYIEKLTQTKDHLIASSVKECERISRENDILGACDAKKRTATNVEKFLELLSKKGGKNALKQLLSGLAKELK